MPVSSLDIISPAFERMKRQLFGPFRFGQWARLALVGFLSGEMGTSGGCSTRFPFNLPSSQQGNQIQAAGPLGGLAAAGIVLLILLGFALAILLLYVSSRMRFVLFDAVVNEECRIRESWSRRGTPAFRYFVFQLLFMLAALISLAVLVGIPLLLAAVMGLFRNPGEHVLALVLGGIVVLGFAFVWIVAIIAVTVLTKDFVVPQLALEDVTVGESWERLWSMMKSEKGGYLGYLGMKLILAIAAAVILGLISLIVIVLLLIPVGGVGALTVLAGRAAGLTWNPLTIAIAIVVGGIIILALVAIGALISVPAIVFFPAYAIYFFADRYAPLRALLFPPPSSPEISTPSPQP